MPTVLLLRHGRSTANAAGILAGRSDGVDLDETGLAQAKAVGARLGDVPLAAVVSSPIARCRATVAAAFEEIDAPETTVDDRLSECDYGDWTGRGLKELASEPSWIIVQDAPSRAGFPGGETMAEMYDRVTTAVVELDARVRAEHGDHAVWLLCSHGDPIKAIISHALAQPFDQFQRIVVDPASVTVIHYGPERTFVIATNTSHGPLASMVPKAPILDAAVGGGDRKEPTDGEAHPHV